jgi:DNA-binding IclR family transcriptional regulator
MASPEPADSPWQAAAVAVLDTGRAALVQDITDSISTEMPSLAAHPGAPGAIRRIVEATVGSLLQAQLAGPTPGDDDLGVAPTVDTHALRQLAQAGLTLPQTWQLHQIITRLVLDALLERVCRQIQAPSADVVGALAALVETSLDHVAATVTDGLQAWMHEGDRRSARQPPASAPVATRRARTSTGASQSPAPPTGQADQPGEPTWVRSTPKRFQPAGRGTLQSVGNALDVLECFATDEVLGTSDLALRLGVAKSTASRLLQTLCSRGFVEKDDETGQYRLGLHMFDLGQLAQARSLRRQAALPTLRHLSACTGLTVTLGQPDGADVVFLERLETQTGEHLLRHWGRRFPAHCTSSGKVIAAHDRAFYLNRARSGFPPRASATIRTRSAWDRAVERARVDGFAMSHSEAVDDLSSVAVPVIIHRRAVAAVSLLGTHTEINRDIGQLLPVLVMASHDISRELRAG